jgi:hypothetical protein
MSEGPRDPVASGASSLSDITLDELDSVFHLSVRALNVCRDNDLITLAAIAQYKQRPGGFMNLRNCGTKTVMELEDLLIKAIDHGWPIAVADPLPAGEPASVNTQLPREEMLGSVAQRFPLLSVRARTALVKFLGDATPEAILDQVLLSGFDLRKIRNIGIKTVAELTDFRQAVLTNTPRPNVVEVPGSPAHAVFSALKNDFDWNEIDQIRSVGLLDDAGHLRYLQLIKGVVDVWGLRSESTWNSIMAYSQTTQRHGAIAQAAEHQHLSRERLRQLFAKWDSKLKPRLSFLSELSLPFSLAPFVLEDPVVIVSESIASVINGHTGVNWSRPFIAKIIAFALSKTYLLVSWDTIGVPLTKARLMDSAHPLLISTDVLDDIIPITGQIYSIQTRSRSSASRLVLTDLANSAGVDWSAVLANALEPLIPFLAPGGTLEGDYLLLPPNRRKRREELVAEVLEEMNTPTHVSALVERLRVIDPEREWTPEFVRSVIVRFKDTFISLSRTSTYGLRKWEVEQEGIKGGTIRSMVEQLLRESETPIHVDELAKVIRTFRPTASPESIRLNIQLEPGKRFSFFAGGYVGLSTRTYDHIPEPKKRVPGSLMRRSVMRQFIGQTMEHFIEHLMNSCDAPADQIERIVQVAVDEGRLVVDKTGVILNAPGTDPPSEGAGQLNDELPFDW